MTILCACATLAHAQVIVGISEGIVGKEARVPIRLRDTTVTSPVTMTGTLRLGNPTVFYPERFIAPNGDSMLAASLTRVNDSTYTLSVTLRFDANAHAVSRDTLVILAGECLAGSDSITSIDLRDLFVNARAASASQGLVIARSIGTPLPYVRFAFLDQNYPNPVPKGSPTNVAYRIDLSSNVTFYIYDVLGKQVMIDDLGTVSVGIHLYVISPDRLGMASGAYWLRLVTESGEAFKKMEVVH